MAEDIRAWLDGLGLGQYAETFEGNDLDLDLVADLSDNDLEKLGVASLGHRKKLMRAIEALGTPASSPRTVVEASPDAQEELSLLAVWCGFEGAAGVFTTPGKDAETIAAFAADLVAHGGRPETIAEVCQDMSRAFAAGVAAHLPNASITFDKFHLVKLLNDAVDQVRRAERKERAELRRSRYLWLKNPANLTAAQRHRLDGLSARNRKTARAYRIRLTFQELYEQAAGEAEAFLKRWYFWATHSRLAPVIEAAKTIKRHWHGVLRWFQTRIANGLLEGINSLIQAAKAKARGYRSTRNLQAIIYLIAGKLDIRLPT